MLQTDPIPFGFAGSYSGITHGGASALSATGTSRPNVNGFFGGGQVGYDHQFGASVVVGIEGDIEGASANGHGAFTGLASTTFSDPASCDPAVKICTDVVGVFCPEPEERRLAWDGAWSFRLSCRANLASLRYRRPRLRRSCSPHFHSAAMGRQRIWTELNLAGRCRQYFGNPTGLDARRGPRMVVPSELERQGRVFIL
jgi:hypothetical protein